MKTAYALSLALTLSSIATAAPVETIELHTRLMPVHHSRVRMTDTFWQPRLKTNREVTLPHNLKMCEETGRIANFARAAGLMEGDYEGKYYNDSDVYKVLEGAAHILANHPNPELEARIDKIIDTIAAAQQDDGYINAWYILMEPDKRWTNLQDMHELYCAGHMFEAAVAYAEATGKTKFLDVARKMADYIDTVFGPEKKIGWPGHEEIELALFKLYKATGERRYYDLGRFFIDVRGQDRDPKASYWQAHLPVREQKEITGHAVRAMYLYSGLADLAALTGAAEDLQPLETLWQDVAYRKLYITGGVGARHHGEAFGSAYELPNDTAYAETCAGIGLALWNSRMLLLHGEARFADMMERVLYNAFPSSVSLEGDTFFYVNPHASDGKRHRAPWFGTACCPTNIVRVMPQVPGYVYAKTNDGIWVNLYAANEAEILLGDRPVRVTQQGNYPWDGEIVISVDPGSTQTFSMNLRKPGWCDSMEVSVNGDEVESPQYANGYMVIERAWNSGDEIEIDMEMVTRRIQAHPQVASNRGRVSLERGPIVFCLEAVDNDGAVFNLALPRDGDLDPDFEEDLFGGIVTIQAEGHRYPKRDWTNHLYMPAIEESKDADVTAVPYCVWDNRAPGEMVVWIPEVTGM